MVQRLAMFPPDSEGKGSFPITIQYSSHPVVSNCTLMHERIRQKRIRQRRIISVFVFIAVSTLKPGDIMIVEVRSRKL